MTKYSDLSIFPKYFQEIVRSLNTGKNPMWDLLGPTLGNYRAFYPKEKEETHIRNK